nr:ribonuclease H-like domain-containing protein [Tanacetum cinerariifolium]
MPLKRDLRLIDEHFESESVDVSTISSSADKTVDITHKGVLCTEEPKSVMKNNFGPPTIEDWHSDDNSEDALSPTVEVKTVKPSVEKIESVKTPRETIKTVKSHEPHKYYPRGNKRNWNNLMSHRLGSIFKIINKACYVCGSFKHLQYVCDKKDDVRPIRNNSNRVNHKKIANKFTHPHPKRGFVPQAVLTQSAKINTTAAIVNTAVNSVSVNDSTARERAVVSGNMRREVNAVKASGNPQQKEYKEKGVINSGCSRHITGNKCYLTDFEAFNGGFFPLEMEKAKFLGETSGILKTFITGIENQLDCKVKVIRSDNGTELKNSVMTQLCDDKGIKREYSVARTPQQNKVAERRNRTLIEAARTMDNLGKFEGKADEGYFVGY